MASMFERKEKTYKKRYAVKYKHPILGTYKTSYFEDKARQLECYLFMSDIDRLKKNGGDWRSRWNTPQQEVTIGEVFELFRSSYIPTLTNEKTQVKYGNVMDSVTKIFPENTPVTMIRSMKRRVAGDECVGWNIYKSTRELMGCSRRGINSYLSELTTIFKYAVENGGNSGNGLIDKNPVKSGVMGDKFRKSQLPRLNPFVWTTEKINALFNSKLLPTYYIEILRVYVLIGIRAKEFTGYNYQDRHKELHWHHIDLKKGEIMIFVGKQSSDGIRKKAPLHPEVVKILKKWKEVDKFDRPLPHGYGWLAEKMKEIKKLTGVNFTNHDLRRLKAQLTEKATHDSLAAAFAIGDKSPKMVEEHYAPISMETQRYLNDQAFKQLTSELEGNA
ncbi:MAG TPA: hypothetical protein DG048_18840 [Pseudoalteromonas sp.]|nr:hypothetical protein [Pseudoalteromonas sp.]|tara:strand:+ start:4067 stop:5230 length:1164 start_codon:yes stop_codon:yes gene_type:complete